MLLADDPPLPRAISSWMSFEQNYIVRTVDPSRINLPTVANLRPEFRPESGSWFTLPSAWIPESRLSVAEAGVPADLRHQLIRVRDGERQFRLFVHPESHRFYDDLVADTGLTEEHEASATASSRSLLVRSKQDPKQLYFVKVSLDVELGGGFRRTVLRDESARCVGTSMYLERVAPRLSQTFQYVAEVLSIIPQGWDQGGQIVRPLPKAVADGSVLMPLFALYAQKPGGSLLRQMASRASLAPSELASQLIVEPFVTAWVDWAVNGAVVMEAHAQNVLLELTPDGIATGRFFLRDLGGFEIDRKAPAFEPANLAGAPVFSTLEADYYPKSAEKMQRQSLRYYFEGGFLFNVNSELVRIDPDYRDGRIQGRLWRKLGATLARVSGLSVDIFSRSSLQTKMPLMLKLAQYGAIDRESPVDSTIFRALQDAAPDVRTEGETWLAELATRGSPQEGVPSAAEAATLLSELRATWTKSSPGTVNR